ncbi:hypothetical protein SAMN05444673_0449 [Bacillus sp. OV166]|uniref:hypothetical protein n=1 Tax=Bacillus sp. OV166 TaxID=1882763 RepID=UPI000A2AC1EB|nr:hypothetical protein [Bacillus sp. OV166]SMQ60985.1 hypothetical protein SAMN05444673_0449 [Bacillus sp. OV166]
MNLKDVLVMEVPSGALKKVVKNKGIDSKLNSTEDMASAIAEQDIRTGNDLANEFKFAGSTAVNLNIVMKGISPDWHNKDYFKTKLSNKFSPAIFTTGIRPVLDKIPRLISAYDQGTKLVLAFSFLGTPRRYLEDFQIVSRSPQIVEYVVIHFSPFAVEVRASHEQNKVFRDSVIDIMGITPSDVVWEKATKLTEEQANELATRLKARLRAAKHKMTEGPYATKEVTAHTQIDDLESDEQYKQEFSNQPMKKKTLVFEYSYSFGYEDSISYCITDEGLWIRSKAGEEVITYVLDQIIQIRYPSESDSDDDLSEVEIDETLSIDTGEYIEEQLAIDIK